MKNLSLITIFFVFGLFNSQQIEQRIYNICKWTPKDGSTDKIKTSFTKTTININEDKKIITIKSSSKEEKLKIISNFILSSDLNGKHYREVIIQSNKKIGGIIRLYDDYKEGCLIILDDSKWYYNK
jgi:hypothetical protein